MVMRTRFPSLCLEYGADEENCERELELSERGMCFYTRWQFAPGTEIGVSVCYADGNGECKRVGLEGIVVDCLPAPAEACKSADSSDSRPASLGCYQVTVLFVDLPEASLGTLRDVSSMLRAVRHSPAAPPANPLPAFVVRPRTAW